MKANAVAKGHKAPLSKRLKRDWHKNKWKYIMILPVLIYLFLFCYKPMYGLVIAFKDYKITRGIEGSSWSNPWYKWFLNFFTDPYFGRLLKNTFLISGLTILFGFPAPIILALMINEVKNSAFKRTVQTITYMPYFISMVVLCGLLKTFCMQDGLFSQIVSSYSEEEAQNYLGKSSIISEPFMSFPIYGLELAGTPLFIWQLFLVSIRSSTRQPVWMVQTVSSRCFILHCQVLFLQLWFCSSFVWVIS